MSDYCFQPIGTIQSCFKQKFAIPRQPGLVPSATGEIILNSEFSSEEIVRGLKSYSHIWVIFIFHKSQMKKGKQTVRPPRLGGGKRMGVFATRSPFRPNAIGQSVVKLENVIHKNKHIHIELSGIDFLDGTPVLDIKPYIPYVDALENATADFAPAAPEKAFDIKFKSEAEHALRKASQQTGKNLYQLVQELLVYDPRSANAQEQEVFATIIFDYDLKWQLQGNMVTVLSFKKIN